MSEHPKPKPGEWWVEAGGKRVQIVGLGRMIDDLDLVVVCRDEAGALWTMRLRLWEVKRDGKPRFSPEV